MRASNLGFIDTVMVLLEANADPSITNKVKSNFSHCLYNSFFLCIMLQDGETALHKATERYDGMVNYEKVIKMLGYSALIADIDKSMVTNLHFVCGI